IEQLVGLRQPASHGIQEDDSLGPVRLGLEVAELLNPSPKQVQLRTPVLPRIASDSALYRGQQLPQSGVLSLENPPRGCGRQHIDPLEQKQDEPFCSCAALTNSIRRP